MEAQESKMRLKNPLNGPLSVQHNGNENSLDHRSPYHGLNNPLTNTITNDITETITEDYNNTSDSVRRNQDTLQWCNTINTIQHQQREIKHSADSNFAQEPERQQRHLFNINNNLAASLRTSASPRTRGTTPSSLCSESSPDDSLLEYEEAQQSCSSVDTSPQDEDRGFDLSDSESFSDDGNLSGDINRLHQSRGIVNPNYPGFQHLAHTLDYSIKVCSDTDFTDDDLDLDQDTTKINCDVNNINNNNNEEDIEFKIDSVNRLDSVENIQKVFYDKPKLNIPLEFDPEKRNNCLDSEEASGSNLGSDEGEDLEGNILQDSDPESNENPSEDVKLNITESVSTADIVGDFKKEIEQELGRLVGRGIEQELEEAVEKLTVANDLSPSALKYNIEPNSDEPFEKSGPILVQTVEVLESLIVKQEIPTQKPETDSGVPKTKEIFEPVILKQEEPINAVIIKQKERFEPVVLKEIKPLSVSENKLEEPIKVLVLESKGSESQEDCSEKLVSIPLQEMADIKVARVTSTEALTLKMNQPFSQIAEIGNFKEKPKSKVSPNTDIPTEEKSKIAKTNLESVEKMETVTFKRRDSNRESEEKENEKMEIEDQEKFCKEDKTKDDVEKDEDSAVPRKKEKIEMSFVKKRRDSSQQIASLITIPRRELGGRNRDNLANRRSLPAAREKKRTSPEVLGGFDVYNIETAMPKIDLDAIESHLRAAREEERRRRTDREEIRRRLAMGSEDDYYNGCDRPGKKPSLQARLQSGMNLQICFMNETVSDTESPNSDTECSIGEAKHTSLPIKPRLQPSNHKSIIQTRPVSLPLGNTQPLLQPLTPPMSEADFFAKQARLQTEARMALAQAKEMAHMQMEVERQRQKKSPITEMVRSSLEKVGIPFPEERRRVSRQILTEMNVAQLQVIVNDLHTQIETLNENLVRFLMNRDDLHMEQDSMLVDIEDLTRYLGAKEQTVKEQKITSQNNNVNSGVASPVPASPLSAINNTVKPRLHRIASLVKK